MIVFHDDVKKADNPSQQLLDFLDKKEPQLVRFLHHTWNEQGRAITYREIREMIMSGQITPDLLDEWQQDYSVFVTKYVRPLYLSAMTAAAGVIHQKYPLFAFDPMADGVKYWTDTMGAAFVTNSTREQIDAVRWVVSRAAQLQDLGVDELARVIRPMVGLNRPQTIANMNYYQRLREGGTSAEKAKEMAIKYSAKQHRYRGHMIARTELAFAYNKGEHLGVEQAIDRGYMGHVVKVWTDAGDNRVCDICRDLHRRTHRQAVEFSQGFGFKTKLKINNPDIDLTPPAHPHCRCVVEYREISAPTFTTV